jgi:hypothetical protein
MQGRLQNGNGSFPTRLHQALYYVNMFMAWKKDDQRLKAIKQYLKLV